MGHPVVAGVFLVMVAGLMSGTCILPSKNVRPRSLRAHRIDPTLQPSFLLYCVASWHPCSTTRLRLGRILPNRRWFSETNPCAPRTQFGPLRWREVLFPTWLTACGCWSKIGRGLCFAPHHQTC